MGHIFDTKGQRLGSPIGFQAEPRRNRLDCGAWQNPVFGCSNGWDGPCNRSLQLLRSPVQSSHDCPEEDIRGAREHDDTPRRVHPKPENRDRHRAPARTVFHARPIGCSFGSESSASSCDTPDTDRPSAWRRPISQQGKTQNIVPPSFSEETS